METRRHGRRATPSRSHLTREVPPLTDAPSQPQRWRGFALRAIFVALPAMWVAYYLGNIPIAGHVGDGTPWTAAGERKLELTGLGSGPVMSLALDGARRLDVIVQTPQPNGATSAQRQWVMRWQKTESPAVSITVAAGAPRSSLRMMAFRRGPAPALQLTPSGSGLSISLSVAPDPHDKTHGGTAPFGESGYQPSATIEIPAGAIVSLVLPDQSEIEALLGDNQGAFTTLPVDAVAIGDDDGKQGMTIADIACGTPQAGTMLWRKLVPAIALNDCSRGGLSVTSLDTKGGVGVTLRGVGYTRRDGHTQVWRGLAWLHENLFGSALLAALVGGIVSWVMGALGNRAKAMK